MGRFEASGKVASVALYKEDLMELEELLAQVAGVAAREVTLDYPTYSEILSSLGEVSGEVYNGFRAEPLRASLGFSSAHPPEAPGSRRVRVTITRNDARFSASAEEDVWVLGVNERLRQFFKTKQLGHTLRLIAVLIACSLLMLLPVFASSVEMMRQGRYLYGWTLACAVIFGAAVIVLAYANWLRGSPAGVILLEKPADVGGHDLSAPLTVAALALVVATLLGVLALVPR